MLRLFQHCAVEDATDGWSKEHHLDLKVALNGAISVDNYSVEHLERTALQGNADAFIWNDLSSKKGKGFSSIIFPINLRNFDNPNE